MESRSGSFMLIGGFDVLQPARTVGPRTPLVQAIASVGHDREAAIQLQEKARPQMRSWICVRSLLVTPSVNADSLCEEDISRKTRAKKRGVKHRTQTELAAEIIAELELPRGAKLIVLGDTAFDADSIRGACEKHKATWITPVNPERVLAGAKPRPKVRSLLEKFKPQQFVAMRLHPGQGKLVPYRRLSPHRVGPKAKVRTFYVHGALSCPRSTLGWRVCCSSFRRQKNQQRGKSLHEPKLS